MGSAATLAADTQYRISDFPQCKYTIAGTVSLNAPQYISHVNCHSRQCSIVKQHAKQATSMGGASNEFLPILNFWKHTK
jgi:hypothetical protein